jgi:hypothetical protein
LINHEQSQQIPRRPRTRKRKLEHSTEETEESKESEESREEMTTAWRRVKRQVRRIGVLHLYRHTVENRWAVSLDNRTYSKWFEIPPDRVTPWLKEFDLQGEPPSPKPDGGTA